ncbi:hypothetical protein Franean1_1385 [Parafrankia sp. EAN1pec]|nr:hypothetical protein Franean1_1385 [Frankia sp. EAN1pec]
MIACDGLSLSEAVITGALHDVRYATALSQRRANIPHSFTAMIGGDVELRALAGRIQIRHPVQRIRGGTWPHIIICGQEQCAWPRGSTGA